MIGFKHEARIILFHTSCQEQQ